MNNYADETSSPPPPNATVADLLTVRYGEHLWPAMDRPLNLFNSILREHYRNPEVVRTAAAEVVLRSWNAWKPETGLFPDALLRWAVPLSEHRRYACRCDQERYCGPMLDERLDSVIDRIVEVVSSSTTWIPNEPQARRYVLAGVGIALVCAANGAEAPDDWVLPSTLKDWARAQYDRYLP